MEERLKIVKHLADLGMLTFSDEELQTMVNDMQEISVLIDGIKEAATEGIEPKLDTVTFENLRKDEPKPSLSRDLLLRNAAEKEMDCFVVPKVVD
jgi:aspartyl-tRNA(Asn)/glutamyl-tRNA(Gln) amidotransferase subunit C